jgi:hypothetical protein
MVFATTDPKDGGVFCTTHYAIQDGVYAWGIRKDWLAKFNMQAPTTTDQMLQFAKDCVQMQPEGASKKTYFMVTGAGGAGGAGGGMLGGFLGAFGDYQNYAGSDGTLQNNMFDGEAYARISYLAQLYAAGVFGPDWYTATWTTGESFWHNNQQGLVYYPAGAFAAEEYSQFNNNADQLNNWEFIPNIGTAMYTPSGNIGSMWIWSKTGFTDTGKLMRAAHMMDTWLQGGSGYFYTIQGGMSSQYVALNLNIGNWTQTMTYADNGTFYITSSGTSKMSANFGNAIGLWQNYGLNVTLQRSNPNPVQPASQSSSDVAYANSQTQFNAWSNAQQDAIQTFARLPNNTNMCNVPQAAIAPNLADYQAAQEIAFIQGTRPMTTAEWAKYQQQWLQQGGMAVLQWAAKQLNVSLPAGVSSGS